MKLPDGILKQHVAVLGKTGSGKSYCAKGLVETLARGGHQVCVLDPTSAWWGLRLGADGKSKGLHFVLIGGKHGDIPLAPQSGAAVARLVTQQHASIVCDLSGMTVGEYTRWFIDFAGTLYTTIREPLHLVIDEAHYFMPQGGGAMDVERGKMLHAGNRLMSGGRSLGIRGMMITQRPAKLHKDALTCADTLIAMRVIAPQDRSAIKDWIDGAGDAAQGRAVLDSLAGLKRGEGWVWYPEGGYLERHKFPTITTYDSSATPEHGAKASPEVSQIDLDEVRSAMAEAVEEAKANDPRELKKQVADLKRQLAEAAKEKPAKVEIKERAVVTDAQIKRAEKLIERLSAASEMAAAAAKEISAAIGQARQPQPITTQRRETDAIIATARTPMQPRDRHATRNGHLPGPQQRILDALAWWQAFSVYTPSREQVAFVAGMSPTSGHFTNVLGAMRSAGLIDYPSSGCVKMSPDGSKHANDPGIAPSFDELCERVTTILETPHRRIFTVLVDSGEEMPRDVLATKAGFSATSGHFTNVLGRLRTLGVIDYPASGQVALSELIEGFRGQ